jgi:hypothetical protein
MKAAKRRSTQNRGKTVKRGRIENLKPWKPGQSGNPGGRPRKTPLTDALQRIVQNPEAADKLARAIYKVGAKGDTRAFKEIADRVQGKVRTQIELTGIDGEEIKHIVDAKLSVGDLLGAISTIYGVRPQRPAGDVPVPSEVDQRPKSPEDQQKK